MAADPILLVAGTWLGAASGVLAVLTIAGFLWRWGIRFRLVGITSFTALLALSCLAFAISYNPRVSVPGAVQVPVVFDNGTDLVVAAAPADLSSEAAAPTVEQVARNLRGGGRGGNPQQTAAWGGWELIKHAAIVAAGQAGGRRRAANGSFSG